MMGTCEGKDEGKGRERNGMSGLAGKMGTCEREEQREREGNGMV